MKTFEMRQAIEEAEATMRAADNCADHMAKTLVGRLRSVNRYNVLKQLKKELEQYNAHTGRWKS